MSREALLVNLGTAEQLSEELLGGPGGKPAGDFELEDPSGKPTKLSDLSGKVVLLDFWGTWCGPCVALLPEVQRLHAEFSGDGLVVLGIACREDDLAAPARVMKEKGCEYRLLLRGEAVADAYGVRGYPTLVLVGRDGVVRRVQVGGATDGGAGLRKAIGAALAEAAK